MFLSFVLVFFLKDVCIVFFMNFINFCYIFSNISIGFIFLFYLIVFYLVLKTLMFANTIVLCLNECYFSITDTIKVYSIFRFFLHVYIYAVYI